ncbi:hypothetical protein [Paenibacillus sp. N3.4]|uniref:hypothetical protein n=1 Tax=Paenibacillus sp. N3.4 TaxID=2603222 RepID=UPI00164F4781|nr:hypothetical protein [Paenibacillus sp. N3.4]
MKDVKSAESYQFANLSHREDLLNDLRSLESRMKTELGHEVALIAYAQGEQEDKQGK